MKLLLRYSIPIFLFFMTTCAYSAADSDLSALLNATHSLRANFTQTIYDNHGKAVQTSYGRMALQRPDKFRWDVVKPIPQLIVANASKLWIYDPDLQQVTIRALHHAIEDSPGLLLSHENIHLSDDFLVKEIEKKIPNSRWFELLPNAPGSMFASIQLGFLNNQIDEMRLQDHLGHTTTIQFKNAQTNIALPASLFVFKAPAHVDVIDETHQKN